MNLSKQLRAVRVYSFTSCLRLTDAVWVVLLAGAGLCALGGLVLASGLLLPCRKLLYVAAWLQSYVDKVPPRRFLFATGE